MASVGTVISYPIPLYQNVPIQPEFFQPRMFFISAISMGQTTTVTTTADMNYVINQEVRLLIPVIFGSRQLNGQIGFVFSIPASNQVVLSINSTQSDPFIFASSTVQSAQIVAIGDSNNGIISATGRNVPSTNVPGAFINISPL